jgi:hypothetical protein
MLESIVHAYPVVIQQQDAVVNHIGGVIGTYGLYFAFTLLPAIQYFLNSMATPAYAKNSDGRYELQPITEPFENKGQNNKGGEFKPSSIEKLSNGSFGKDPLENKNSLEGLIVRRSPEFRYQGVRPGMTNRGRFQEYEG